MSLIQGEDPPGDPGNPGEPGEPGTDGPTVSIINSLDLVHLRVICHPTPSGCSSNTAPHWL